MAPLTLPSFDDASTVLEAAAAKNAKLKARALLADARYIYAKAVDDGAPQWGTLVKARKEAADEARDRQLDSEHEEREAMRIVILVASRGAAE